MAMEKKTKRNLTDSPGLVSVLGNISIFTSCAVFWRAKNLFLWFRSRHHWRNLFHFSQRQNNRLSIVQITDQFNFFTLGFLSRKKRNSFWQAKTFFLTWIQFVACALQENLSNRSSRVQIPRDICTRFGRLYLYSTKWSWMIMTCYCQQVVLIRVINLWCSCLMILHFGTLSVLHSARGAVFYFQCWYWLSAHMFILLVSLVYVFWTSG